MNATKLFDLLDDWRYLPAYQLERRADVFFGMHLKEILHKKYGSEIDEIIPEFPIRKGSLPQNTLFNKNPKERKNQSFKNLFKKLSDKGLIKGINASFEIINANLKIEIIYIQPTRATIDNSIITFQDIIDNLKAKSNSELTKRFLKSLKKWQSAC